jgi:two-component system KDP operon response regulator KdpE
MVSRAAEHLTGSLEEPVVLAVDDDAPVRRLVQRTLRDEGFKVVTASNGVEALRVFGDIRPDLVVLDLLLPDTDGFELLRQMRDFEPVPAIILSQRSRRSDIRVGLDLGADDYLGKPFDPEELGARARALLRRAGGRAPNGPVRLPGLNVDVDIEHRVVTRKGKPVWLTRHEWGVLREMALHPNTVLGHAELLTNVWGADYRDDVRTLRTTVGKLRRKLGVPRSTGGPIKTIPRLGYLLDVDGTAGRTSRWS